DEVTAGGNTALLRAAANVRLEAAKFLLDHGADPSAADDNGMTALHYAVHRGLYVLRGQSHKPYNDYLYRPDQPELVKALLEHKANPNARLKKGVELADYVHGNNPVGATPLLLAAATNDPAIMRMLTAAGADPNIGQTNGITPVMMAAGL